MGTHPIFESDFDCLTEMVGPKDIWDEVDYVYDMDLLATSLAAQLLRRDKNPVIQRALRVLEESKCRKLVAPKEVLVIRSDTSRYVPDLRHDLELSENRRKKLKKDLVKLEKRLDETPRFIPIYDPILREKDRRYQQKLDNINLHVQEIDSKIRRNIEDKQKVDELSERLRELEGSLNRLHETTKPQYVTQLNTSIENPPMEIGTVTSEPVKMEKSIIQIVPNYPNSSHPQHNLKLTQPLKEPANRTYESGYDSLKRPSSSHRPTTLRGKDDSKMTNSLPNDAVLSGSHSSLVGSQASSLFDQIAGKNVEIGALKNQVYMLRKNLESQNAKIISKMDEELENSTRKMQQNMNFSPEVSFQPTESQASLFKHLEDLQHENDNLNNTVKDLKERLMLHAEDSDDELFTEDNITQTDSTFSFDTVIPV